MITHDVEQLFAYHDGDLSPADAGAVEQHLADCPQCRETLRRLTDLHQLSSPPAGLSEMQISRLARTVITVTRSRGPWSRIGSMLRKRLPSYRPNGPVDRYLNLRQRGFLPPGGQSRLMLAAFALPALLLRFFPGASGNDFLLAVLGLTALALPGFILYRGVYGPIQSLWRGRVLEDLLLTGITPAEVVDGLALHSLKTCLGVALPLAAILMGSTLTSGSLDTTVWLEREAWWPVWLAGLVLLGVYAVQGWIISADLDPRRQKTNALLRRAALVGPLAVLALVLLGLWFSGWSPAQVRLASVAAGAVALLVCLVGLRRQAVVGLSKLVGGPTRQRGPQAASNRRWWRPWNDHPLVVREIAREAYLPYGVLGLIVRILLQFSPAVVFAATLLFLLRRNEDATAIHDGMLALIVVVWPMCGLRTLEIINRERESGSWEVLLSTPMSLHSMVGALLQIAVYPRRWWFLSPALVLVPASLYWNLIPGGWLTNLLFVVMALSLVVELAYLAGLTGILVAFKNPSPDLARNRFYLESASTLANLAMPAALVWGVALLGNQSHWPGYDTIVLVRADAISRWTILLPYLILNVLTAVALVRRRRELDRWMLQPENILNSQARKPDSPSLLPVVLAACLASVASQLLSSELFWKVRVEVFAHDSLALLAVSTLVWLFTGQLLYRKFLRYLAPLVRPVRLTNPTQWLVTAVVGAVCGAGMTLIGQVLRLEWLCTGEAIAVPHGFLETGDLGKSLGFGVAGALLGMLVLAATDSRTRPRSTPLLPGLAEAARPLLRSALVLTTQVVVLLGLLVLAYQQPIHPGLMSSPWFLAAMRANPPSQKPAQSWPQEPPFGFVAGQEPEPHHVRPQLPESLRSLVRGQGFWAPNAADAASVWNRREDFGLLLRQAQNFYPADLNLVQDWTRLARALRSAALELSLQGRWLEARELLVLSLRYSSAWSGDACWFDLSELCTGERVALKGMLLSLQQHPVSSSEAHVLQARIGKLGWDRNARLRSMQSQVLREVTNLNQLPDRFASPLGYRARDRSWENYSSSMFLTFQAPRFWCRAQANLVLNLFDDYRSGELLESEQRSMATDHPLLWAGVQIEGRILMEGNNLTDIDAYQAILKHLLSMAQGAPEWPHFVDLGAIELGRLLVPKTIDGKVTQQYWVDRRVDSDSIHKGLTWYRLYPLRVPNRKDRNPAF